MVPLASITVGSNWVVNEARLNEDFELLKTHLEDILRGKNFTLVTEQFGPRLFCTTNLNRENGHWCCEWFDSLRHKHLFLHVFPCFFVCKKLTTVRLLRWS